MNFFKKLLYSRLRKAPTRSQWFADIRNLERLREILADDVFIAATNHVIDERRINEFEVFNHPKLLKLRAAYSAGHTSFIRDLETLSKLPAMAPAPMEEWGHIGEEDLED